jgi:hypothetical protein
MPMVNAYSSGNKRANIAGKNRPEFLTSFAIILHINLCGFYPQIINDLPAVNAM